ncbi:MAG: MBL fold metallo-hydrolase [Pleurocapsa minor GSE-CHR-MK-17-07R]|jgi:glyoxylase-like metal-dependent hydrolase (beta-lactamase superfamily II)|nr:MBL fold metallo-hydrolase [Pleurocapsa minor GSE-CHR-MK 17-07R]
MKKIFDGVYMLEGDVVGRPLQLMYLRGNRASLLLDTGCAGDPERFIVPQIREAGGDPAALTWIINSHTDFDHTGGNHAMKRIAPRALLACGDDDAEAAADPNELFSVRYDAYREPHGIFYDEGSVRFILGQSGSPEPIDVTFVDGETIRLGDDWEVQVIALPGHADGHIGIYDEKHHALYGADAIHGAVYTGLDGLPKLPPTYLFVDDYLDTIDLIESLPLDVYIGCHWPVKRGAEIAAFCKESRDFVYKADEALMALLAKGPVTAREACLTLGPILGDWEHTPGLDVELIFAINGHLERLVDQEKAVVSRRGGINLYQRAW